MEDVRKYVVAHDEAVHLMRMFLKDKNLEECFKNMDVFEIFSYIEGYMDCMAEHLTKS